MYQDSRSEIEQGRCMRRESTILLTRCRLDVSGLDDRKWLGGTYNQKLPARLMCSQPASTPPIANPRFVGMRIEPADAGDQPRTAIA